MLEKAHNYLVCLFLTLVRQFGKHSALRTHFHIRPSRRCRSTFPGTPLSMNSFVFICYDSFPCFPFIMTLFIPPRDDWAAATFFGYLLAEKTRSNRGLLFFCSPLAALTSHLVATFLLIVCIGSINAAITQIAYNGASNPSSTSRFTTTAQPAVSLTMTVTTTTTNPAISVFYIPVTAGDLCPDNTTFTCTGSGATSFVCSGTVPAIGATAYSNMNGICKGYMYAGTSSQLYFGNSVKVPTATSFTPTTTQVGTNLNLTVRIHFILSNGSYVANTSPYDLRS
jgi:hypothetical protein